MKPLHCIPLLCLVLGSCQQKDTKTAGLEKRIDSLEKRLSESYKPGFGEFMESIQVHHAKLWFAGTNQNWPLADFEMGEIKENIEAIEHYCTDRMETKSIGILTPALDGVTAAINQKDKAQFEQRYTQLTAACNTCHQSTHHEYNVITIPTSPPYSNQEFQLNP